MAIKFSTTRAEAAQSGVKILLYGDAGFGKTRAAATAPRPVIVSAESGLLSLAGYDLPVVVVRSVNDFNEVYRWVTESAEAKGFDTVYIDSLSEIAEQVLSNAKAQVKDPRQAYGELIEKTMMSIRAFRDLPGKHVIMTAKMERIKDDMTGSVMYQCSMPGTKLGPQIPYLFDEVFRLGIGKTPEGVDYRFFQTQPDLQYAAKDRSGRLDPIERPDFTFVINKILAGTAQAPAPASQPEATSQAS